MAFTNTASALRTFGGLMVSRLLQGLEENNSNAYGNLNKSIAFEIKETSKGLDWDLSMEDYYLEVDEGVKPKGKQPSYRVAASDIEHWLRSPLIKDKMENRGFNITDKSIPPLSKRIANRLTIDGRDGTNFYTNVVNSRLVTQDLDKTVTQAISEDIDELLASLLDGIK